MDTERIRMMKMMKRFFPLLVLVSLLFVLTACDKGGNEAQSQAQPQVKQEAVKGAQAPNITLKDMAGNSVSLDQFKGKVVILNFWATWCPPCKEEMPSMEVLYRNYKDKGLVMLAVNVEENGKKAVGDFLKQQQYSFPILLDEKGVAQNTYGVFRFPESFIIDRNGIIVEKIIGGRNWLAGPTFKMIDFLVKG
ncbi:MAG: thioredoxin [Desulfuromonas sp.]|nr:MAG: thioredoxin [Desulfuromonas sp.]